MRESAPENDVCVCAHARVLVVCVFINCQLLEKVLGFVLEFGIVNLLGMFQHIPASID